MRNDHDGAPKATRRSTAEVRELALQAGRSLFTERGFEATTTKDIADRAGIAEAVLFRHFGSKRGLLEASLVEPLTQFSDRFLAEWASDRAPTRIEHRTRLYIEQIYDLLSENRQLLAVLVAEDSTRQTTSPPALGEALQALFARFEPMAKTDFNARGWRRQDTGLALRLTFGLVASLVLLDHWLWPSNRSEAQRAHLVDGVVEYVLHGVGERE